MRKGEAGALEEESEGGSWPATGRRLCAHARACVCLCVCVCVCSQVVPAATVTSLHDVVMWL